MGIENDDEEGTEGTEVNEEPGGLSVNTFEEPEIFDGSTEDPEPTPLHDDNKEILKKCTVGEYQDAFQRVFLELLDFGKGYVNAKNDFTSALLTTGSRENPQDVYAFMDEVTDRMEKIYIVKRLCALLGLQGEEDQIVKHELERIYNRPVPRRATYGPVGFDNSGIAGDVRNGKQ